jgi:hypothetical protein
MTTSSSNLYLTRRTKLLLTTLYGQERQVNALAVLAGSNNDKEATVIGFLVGKKKITQQQKYHGSKL